MTRGNSSVDVQDFALGVDVSNFGPISQGKFTIRPLTLFIGPNNSGKTYAAKLAHSLFSAHVLSTRSWSFPALLERQILKPEFQALLSEMQAMLDSTSGTQHMDIPNEYIDKVKTMIFRRTIEVYLPGMLTNIFGVDLQDLVRINSQSSTIKISNSLEITISFNDKIGTTYSFSNMPYVIKNIDTVPSARPQSMADHNIDNTPLNDMVEKIVTGLEMRDNHGLIALLSLFLQILLDTGKYLPLDSHYLPSGRSGIMHAYRPFMANVIRHSQSNGDAPSSTPKISGALSDFASRIMAIDEKTPGELVDLGKSLETDLFNGELVLSEDSFGMLDIVYRFMGKDLPLHTTSSGIAECAPISLLLRFKIGEGMALIIDEPEAHLHPGNQLILAKYIVRLVRKGVRVMLATHSAFLLEKLSTFVMLGALTPEQRQARGYDKDDYLNDSEVGPYIFQKNSMGDHIIKEIDHSARDGISQEEFIDIGINMHNEGINIEKMIEDNDE